MNRHVTSKYQQLQTRLAARTFHLAGDRRGRLHRQQPARTLLKLNQRVVGLDNFATGYNATSKK
jgi:hypothetical protein